MFDQVQQLIVLRVFLAGVAGVVVGYDRERSGKAAGIRTQMLVCVGSALLAGMSVSMAQVFGQPMADPARLMAQIVSGIGFLGAGVILKNGGNRVTGVTTAATIWTTAAIGIAIGAGFYLPAGLTVILVLLLNPLAVYQYQKGLKGDLYVLEVALKEQMRVVKILERLKIKNKVKSKVRRKLQLLLVSSDQRNSELLDMLGRRGIKAVVEEVELE